jgi:hypothetical protein
MCRVFLMVENSPAYNKYLIINKASIDLCEGLSGIITALFLQPLENINRVLILQPKDLHLSRYVVINFVLTQ